MSDVSVKNSGSIPKNSQAKDILRRFVRNRAAVLGLAIILVFLVCSAIPQVLSPYDPYEQELMNQFQAPSREHPLGTDEYGRDILSRVIYGCRTSLGIGIISVSISCAIGVTIGTIAGYYGGAVENVLMRGIDILMAIPTTLLGISIVAAFGQSVANLILAISLGSICPYARLVRVSVLSVKNKEFVEAARSMGASNARIMMKYILPNCLAPIIVQASMSIAAAIMLASGLSFLGLGVPQPTCEWGTMASTGRNYIRDSWWIVTYPGLAIMATVFSFNLFGDGLRDALDPKLKN